jgi:hypothetical protein
MLSEVAHTYFRDERQREWFPDRSLWSLNNAFTQVVKELTGFQTPTDSPRPPGDQDNPHFIDWLKVG